MMYASLVSPKIAGIESRANTTFAMPIAAMTIISGVNIRRSSTLVTSLRPS